jgi:hypothetical protein
MEYAGGGANYRVYVANKGQITLSGSYHKFTNGAAGQLGAFLCEQYAILYLNSATITWTANVTYGVTLTVRAIGYCEAAATVCTITGFTVTGIRYNVVTNAVVNGTGNINLFPGTVEGAVATGGVYQ